MKTRKDLTIPPRIVFQNALPVTSKEFSLWKEAKLFMKAKRKFINDKGEIHFEFEGQLYSYQIREEELLFKYKNSFIRARYDLEDLSTVHVFDYKTDTFLSTIQPMELFSKDNKGALGRHKKDVSNIVKYIKAKRDVDFKIEHGPKDFKIQSRNDNDIIVNEISKDYGI